MEIIMTKGSWIALAIIVYLLFGLVYACGFMAGQYHEIHHTKVLDHQNEEDMKVSPDQINGKGN